MPTRPTLYFDQPGQDNTEDVVWAVRERAEELGIAHVLVASSTGRAARALLKALEGSECRLVVVTHHAGYTGADELQIAPDVRAELAGKGVTIVTGTHSLSGVGRSFTSRYGGVTLPDVIAHTLRRFGDGVKVAVEIAIMAADAGAIPTDCEVIAAGGSARGLDSALVLRAAHMNTFFDLEVREIVAMRRQGPAE